VSCNLKDAMIENTLSFVGMGETPIGQKNGDESDSSDNDAPNKPGTKYIATIEKRKVKTGETLESIAGDAGMTQQALAKFNWGTDNPEEVNEHLHRRVGCTKGRPPTGRSIFLMTRMFPA
jgi:LysM repeat protein